MPEVPLVPDVPSVPLVPFVPLVPDVPEVVLISPDVYLIISTMLPSAVPMASTTVVPFVAVKSDDDSLTPLMNTSTRPTMYPPATVNVV